MSDETLAELMSGARTQRDSADLLAELQTLLDDSDKGGGRHDPVLFWSFVASLAQGRGVAEELETQAAEMLSVKNPPKQTTDDLWKRWQWAILFKMIKQLLLSGNELLPQSFCAAAFMAPASNVVHGDGRYVDPLDLRTSKGNKWALTSMAKVRLVEAVLYRMLLDGISEPEAMRVVLPSPGRPTAHEIQLNEGFYQTWAGQKGWKKMVAKWRGVSVEQLVEKVGTDLQNKTALNRYLMSEAEIKFYWEIASKLR